MGFLRRLLGGPEAPADDATQRASQADAADPDADERMFELELLRAENDRLDDLRRRQLRYAEYAWTPPSQGSERRADDGDANA